MAKGKGRGSFFHQYVDYAGSSSVLGGDFKVDSPHKDGREDDVKNEERDSPKINRKLVNLIKFPRF